MECNPSTELQPNDTLSRLSTVVSSKDYNEAVAAELTASIVTYDPQLLMEHAETLRSRYTEPRISYRHRLYCLAYDALSEVDCDNLSTQQQKLMDRIQLLSQTDLPLAVHMATQERRRSGTLSDTTTETLLSILCIALNDPTADDPYRQDGLYSDHDFNTTKRHTVMFLFKYAPASYYTRILTIIPEKIRAEELHYSLTGIINNLGSTGNPDDIAKVHDVIETCYPPSSIRALQQSCISYLRLYEVSGDAHSPQTAQTAVDTLLSLPTEQEHPLMSRVMSELYTAGQSHDNPELLDAANAMLAWRHQSPRLLYQNAALCDMVVLHTERGEWEAALNYAEAMHATIPDEILEPRDGCTSAWPSYYLEAVGTIVKSLVDAEQRITAGRLVMSHILLKGGHRHRLSMAAEAVGYVLGLTREISTMQSLRA